mmetsp:Transcript_29072/g.84492  ORF Transcript_29072/g.84492 Transcript_29072/m.84492 type:complete len:254 (-) Transcript_29072:710-1471(-)
MPDILPSLSHSALWRTISTTALPPSSSAALRMRKEFCSLRRTISLWTDSQRRHGDGADDREDCPDTLDDVDERVERGRRGRRRPERRVDRAADRAASATASPSSTSTKPPFSTSETSTMPFLGIITASSRNPSSSSPPSSSLPFLRSSLMPYPHSPRRQRKAMWLRMGARRPPMRRRLRLCALALLEANSLGSRYNPTPPPLMAMGYRAGARFCSSTTSFPPPPPPPSPPLLRALTRPVSISPAASPPLPGVA